MNVYAPIIIFTYRRDIIKLIESLQANKLASRSDLIIYSDGNKSEDDLEDIKKVREKLYDIQGFNNVFVIESKTNKGLANSIINGVSDVIQKYGKVIVLEDDLIVASDFLDYMNEALDFYLKDPAIWSISGYGPRLPDLKNYEKDVYLSVRASSWGWATWKDRWIQNDWQITDFKKFKSDKKLIKSFNKGGNDMYNMLELQILGKIDSWAIRWCYNQFKLDKYTVYPINSKVFNNGFADEKAIHNNGGKWEKFFIELNNNKIILVPLRLDNSLVSHFSKVYDIGIYTKIGYMLKKYGGYKIIKRMLKQLKGLK